MARFRAFRSEQVPDIPDSALASFLRRFQDAVGDAITLLTEVPLLDFTWKRDVVLAAGANQVPHGLGRAWRGYIVTRQNAAITVYAPDDQALRERILTLTASGSGVVDLFMF